MKKNTKIAIGVSVGVAAVLGIIFRQQLYAFYYKIKANISGTTISTESATYKAFPADINQVTFPVGALIKEDQVLSIGMEPRGLIGIYKRDNENVYYDGDIDGENKQWDFPYSELVEKCLMYVPAGSTNSNTTTTQKK